MRAWYVRGGSCIVRRFSRSNQSVKIIPIRRSSGDTVQEISEKQRIGDRIRLKRPRTSFSGKNHRATEVLFSLLDAYISTCYKKCKKKSKYKKTKEIFARTSGYSMFFHKILEKKSILCCMCKKDKKISRD
jgi:hypothetical protein